MEVRELKLPEDDTEVSKHVELNIRQRENIVIYICALVDCNKTNYKYQCVFIIIIFI
jgi:hypothetical protein